MLYNVSILEQLNCLIARGGKMELVFYGIIAIAVIAVLAILASGYVKAPPDRA